MKTILTLLACSVLAVAASAKVSEKFTQTYPLAANGTIRVENVNGSIEIVAWDKAEVSLEAEKIAREQEGLDRMHLKIESSAQSLSIKTELEKKWKFWDNMNAQVHYKLMVPAGVSLDRISVVNANIEVVGVKGRVNLQSVNGSIKARDMSSSGKFETVNGSVNVTYASLAGRPDIELQTVNGGCTVKLPADAAFELDADTVNGHVNCDFPITLTKSSRHELRGSVGGGGARVELDSVNGGLSVSKS